MNARDDYDLCWERLASTGTLTRHQAREMFDELDRLREQLEERCECPLHHFVTRVDRLTDIIERARAAWNGTNGDEVQAILDEVKP